MLQKTLALLGLLFATGVHAHGMTFPLEIIEYLDNTRVVAFVSEDDIARSRAWQPFEAMPPLSMGEALEALRKDLDSEPGVTGMQLTGIELKPIPHHDRQWHYLVKLRVTRNGGDQARYFVVMMDGKVIPALKEPEMVK